MDEVKVDNHHQDPPSCLIKRLPLELLLQITSLLPTPDLGHMRLTCRAIENMLLNTFAEEFFSRKQFMLSFFSLNALIDISKSRMGRHIRRLQFGTDLILEDTARFFMPDRPGITELYAAQSELLHTGVHRDMLVEALRNLENLEDVVIRSFNSHRRSRDGPHAQWRSYGATTADGGAGRLTRMEYYVTEGRKAIHFSHLLFNSLLDALGAAGSRPTGIEIMGRGAPPLGDGAFALNPSIRPSVPAMLHGLEKLHLHVVTSTSETSNSTGAPDKPPPHSSILPWFLTHTPNLKNLRINETSRWSRGLDTFLAWLGQPMSDADSGSAPGPGPDEHGWPPPVALPKLEELSLGHMATRYTAVLGLIRKFAPTLKRLELWRVTLGLDEKALPSGLTTDSSDQESTFRPFLYGLLDIPADLRHIMMGFLSDEQPVRRALTGQSPWPWPPQPQVVSFGGGDPNRVAYTGPDWKSFIRELLATHETAEIIHSDDTSVSHESISVASVEEDSEME